LDLISCGFALVLHPNRRFDSGFDAVNESLWETVRIKWQKRSLYRLCYIHIYIYIYLFLLFLSERSDAFVMGYFLQAGSRDYTIDS
jgi:hypothetical protein